MVEKPGIFQGYYLPFCLHLGMDRHLREQFKDHPQFHATAEFCANTTRRRLIRRMTRYLPLSFFEPMMERLCLRSRKTRFTKPRCKNTA